MAHLARFEADAVDDVPQTDDRHHCVPTVVLVVSVEGEWWRW